MPNLLGLQAMYYNSTKYSLGQVFVDTATNLSSLIFAYSYNDKFYPTNGNTNKYVAIDTSQFYWKITANAVDHVLVLNTDKLLNSALLNQAVSTLFDFGKETLTFEAIIGTNATCCLYAVGLVFGAYVSPTYYSGHITISPTDGLVGYEYIASSTVTSTNSYLLQYSYRNNATYKTCSLVSYRTGAKDLLYHKYSITIDLGLISVYPNPIFRVLQVRINVDDMPVINFQIPNIPPFDTWANLMPYISMKSDAANQYQAITGWMVRG